MALDHMAIVSGGLWPTSPTDFTERSEYIVSRGLFIDFPGFVVAESVYNLILNIGRAGIRFAQGILRIGR